MGVVSSIFVSVKSNMNKNYYVYITTNPSRSTLYIGVTNNISKRLNQHYIQRGRKNSFAGKYHCYNLIYFEIYNDVIDAISREKEIKKWNRKKKENLINSVNPEWKFIKDYV